MAGFSIKQLDFKVIEYTELLSKLINYQYRSRSLQAIEDILTSIRVVFERKFSSIEVSPKLIGHLGQKYDFNFAHHATFIDYIKADKIRRMLNPEND